MAVETTYTPCAQGPRRISRSGDGRPREVVSCAAGGARDVAILPADELSSLDGDCTSVASPKNARNGCSRLFVWAEQWKR